MTQEEVRNTIQKDCRKGHHRLEVIYRHGGEMECDTVRWCTICGSVVVDVDFDGRTDPGSIMKMTLPEISKSF
jgi:hypothetical protein